MINQNNNDLYDLNEALKVENLTINDYEEICKRLKRKPNRTELGMFGVMWSEHCCYRNSKPLLSKFPIEGKNVLVGPGDNAGVIADFLFEVKTGQIKYYLVSRSNPKIQGSRRWKLNIENINDQQPGLVFCESNSLDDLLLIKSSVKNEFLQKGKKIIDRFDDMKNIASNKLEDWLEEDEDISQNLDLNQKSFYNDDISKRSFSNKKDDDPWI